MVDGRLACTLLWGEGMVMLLRVRDVRVQIRRC